MTLPRVVYEHFRFPLHEGPLAAPDAIGTIEGRRPGSRIHLLLALGEGGTRGTVVREAKYLLEGDRTCVAALSLLTSWMRERPVAEVEQARVETVAAAFKLPDELLPMLVPALEVLRAALARLRGEPSPFLCEGRLVCTCLHVREGRILRAVRERGLRTVEEVQRWTRACTGCRSCRPDVVRLLAAGRATARRTGSPERPGQPGG